ncbi:ATP binding [Mactra antiquata]
MVHIRTDSLLKTMLPVVHCMKRTYVVNRCMKQVTVCVEGNIGCGKTTFISHFRKYDDFVEKHEEPVNLWRNYGDVNPLSAMYRDPKRWAFTFQSLVLLTLFQQHVQKQSKPIRVMERSVFSAKYCFVENQRNRGLLNSFEYTLLNEMFGHALMIKPINVDLIVYLRTSPENCFHRIRKRNRPEEQNITLDYLQQLHQLHESWLIKGDLSTDQNQAEVSSLIKPPVLVVDGDCDKNTVEDKFPDIHSQIMSELQVNLG